MDELLQAQTENTMPDGRQEGEPVLYEAGFHLTPNLSGEALSAEVMKIKDWIATRHGVVISEGTPQRMNLAYKLPRVIDNVRSFFDSAYFGWIRFEAAPQEVAAIEQFLKGNAAVIRFILFRAQPEKIHAATRKMTFFAQKSPMKEKEEGKVADKKLEKERTETPSAFSETEMDKTIEELIRE